MVIFLSDHTEIENVIGTNLKDMILGNNLINNINAGDGFDIIYHFGNSDTIDGGHEPILCISLTNRSLI